MIDFVKVGQRIAEQRKIKGLSQGELAEKLFVTRQALSKWENGLAIPSIDTICEISKIFSVSIERLLGLFEPAEELEIDENDIFKGHDRSYIVNAIANGQVKVSIPDVLYLMSPAERMLILKHVRDGIIEPPIRELWVKLTPAEQKFLGGTQYDI